MIRTLPFLLAAGLAVGLTAQDIPGVKARLDMPRSVVGAANAIDFRLTLEITADTTVPASLLSGMTLAITVNEEPGPQITEKGNGGEVALAKGTRIERTVSLPAARFVPNASASEFSTVAVQWVGLTGANCVFKIAPDASKLDIAALDHSKTKVVLVTNHGEMTVSFRPDKAPKHVESFLNLCKSGFYDGTKFHRVIRNFMIQGGDMLSKDDSQMARWGQGQPGFKLQAEFSDIRHVRGTLSAARLGGDVNSASSQFYIVHKDAPHLDNQYSAFGNLEAGTDVLDSIANVQTGQNDVPVKHVVLEAAVILPVMK